jgi:macrodomain Ter protein organizer (MatP/YcbG family)
MGNTTQYWTFLRLEPAGTYRPIDKPTAQTFLQTTWNDIGDLEIATDAAIQAELLTLMGDALMGNTLLEAQNLAQLCLRCFISQQIVQTCRSLVNQFGAHYQFQLSDLLPLVLDDDGRVPSTDYPSLAKQILASFQADSGSFSNWVIRLVRQHREVNQFLLEHGLYLISDWAILNDTPIDRLQKTLTEFYQLSPSEIASAVALLESYRAVYLADRLQQRQQNAKRQGQCPPPTPEQLQRIGDRIQTQTGKTYTPETLLSQLCNLAQRLRQYRIAIRSGQLPTQSMDIPEIQAKAESQTLDRSQPADSSAPNQFLQQYRQIFLESLDTALAKVIQGRLDKAKNPEKAERFLRALDLFYCQRKSMTEIATAIGVGRQDNVTYLLKLKDLRADVRHLMLCQLRDAVREQAKAFANPDRLDQLSQELDEALSEQVDQMIAAEEKRAQTPKEFMQDSLFAQRLCHYLDLLLGG